MFLIIGFYWQNFLTSIRYNHNNCVGGLYEENYSEANNNYYENEINDIKTSKTKKESQKVTKTNVIGTYYNPISLVDY